MLLGNYNVIHKSPGRFRAGVGAICDNNFSKNGSLRAIHTAQSSPKLWGLPTGYGQNGWMLPRVAGYVVGFSEIQLGQTGTAVMGINGDGGLDIIVSGTANLSLISSGTGTCTISLTMGGDMAAALYGSGSISGTVTGTGTLGAIAFSTGESTITLTADADITALGYMTGEMSPFTPLSPEGLAKAVWDSLATEYNTVGTMGAKLNTASSGGVDMNALAQAVWEYGVRSLTESAGLTTEEHDKLMSITGGGGGFSVNYQAINSHTTKKINEVKEELEKKISEIPQVSLEGVEGKINEIESHISLAKDETIDRINESEIDLRKDIRSTKTELKEDNVKTRNLVRQKTGKLNENVQKLSDRQDLTDKTIEDEADKLDEEIERILQEEVDMIENEIFNKEADDIESELNSNQQQDANS